MSAVNLEIYSKPISMANSNQRIGDRSTPGVYRTNCEKMECYKNDYQILVAIDKEPWPGKSPHNYPEHSFRDRWLSTLTASQG